MQTILPTPLTLDDVAISLRIPRDSAIAYVDADQRDAHVIRRTNGAGALRQYDLRTYHVYLATRGL